MKHTDYYQTMGLEKTASQKQVKQAYRKLARKYHPDVNDAENATEKFKVLAEAYQVLKDPDKRAVYDRLGYSQENTQYDSNSRRSEGVKGNVNNTFHINSTGCFALVLFVSIVFFAALNFLSYEKLHLPDKEKQQKQQENQKKFDAYNKKEKQQREIFYQKIADLKAFIEQDTFSWEATMKLKIFDLRPNFIVLKNGDITRRRDTKFEKKKVFNANAYYSIGRMVEGNARNAILSPIFGRSHKSWENEAVACFKKAIELDPITDSHHISLARRAHSMKDYQLAIKHYKIAVHLNPNNGFVWRVLREIREEQKKKRDNIDSLNRKNSVDQTCGLTDPLT